MTKPEARKAIRVDGKEIRGTLETTKVEAGEKGECLGGFLPGSSTGLEFGKKAESN